MKNQIYLDAQATTPLDPLVLNAMLPYFTEIFGNGNHYLGQKASQAVELARFEVSSLIGAKPSEIIFTSGSTEAINLGILGAQNPDFARRNQIISQPTEHKAVLSCLEQLRKRGYQVVFLDVDKNGIINTEQLKNLISERTFMVSVMYVNNEIGCVQPVSEIGRICQEVGALFFSDLTQGVGWSLIDVHAMKVDIACLSAHKMYGPKGVGALYLRRNNKFLKLKPIIHGGGQERNLRSGTLNFPGIVGFGQACKTFAENRTEIYNKLNELRNTLQDRITSQIKGVQINGLAKLRHPGNLNISIDGIDAETIRNNLPNISFSSSSACNSASLMPSHVLRAIKLNDSLYNSTFRFGVHRFNTKLEIEQAAAQFIAEIEKFREHNIKISC